MLKSYLSSKLLFNLHLVWPTMPEYVYLNTHDSNSRTVLFVLLFVEETFPLDYSQKKGHCHQVTTEMSFNSASCPCWCLADNAQYCMAGSYFMRGIKESSLGQVKDSYIFPNPYIYSPFKSLNSKGLNICFLFLNAL